MGCLIAIIYDRMSMYYGQYILATIKPWEFLYNIGDILNIYKNMCVYIYIYVSMCVFFLAIIISSISPTGLIYGGRVARRVHKYGYEMNMKEY